MTTHRWLGAALLGLALTTLVPGTGPTSVEVISPPPGAVVTADPFYVIARGGPADLTVDGQSQAWANFAGPVRAACLRLEPGRHDIRVGPHALAVSVLGPQTHPPTEGVRVHPIGSGADACGACHETERHADGLAVAAVQAEKCLTCHRPAEFELKHAHPLEPLKHCNSCHAPHGSSHRGLLKAPVKELCASCHES